VGERRKEIKLGKYGNNIQRKVKKNRTIMRKKGKTRKKL
jgi:hypothetical protein